MTTPNIGTPTFSIDDHAKVTGGAKDPEFNRRSVVKDVSRRGVLNGAVALGTVGCGGRAYAGCPYRKLYPAVLVMKSTEDRPRGELAKQLDRPIARWILVQDRCVRS